MFYGFYSQSLRYKVQQDKTGNCRPILELNFCYFNEISGGHHCASWSTSKDINYHRPPTGHDHRHEASGHLWSAYLQCCFLLCVTLHVVSTLTQTSSQTNTLTGTSDKLNTNQFVLLLRGSCNCSHHFCRFTYDRKTRSPWETFFKYSLFGQ